MKRVSHLMVLVGVNQVGRVLTGKRARLRIDVLLFIIMARLRYKLREVRN